MLFIPEMPEHYGQSPIFPARQQKRNRESSDGVSRDPNPGRHKSRPDQWIGNVPEDSQATRAAHLAGLFELPMDLRDRRIGRAAREGDVLGNQCQRDDPEGPVETEVAKRRLELEEDE